MNREDLLFLYFNIDSSGNDIDGYHNHYIRVREDLITKNKKTEFLHIMDTLIPEWIEDGMVGGKFSIVGVDYKGDQLCICTQCITDLCYLKHPVLPYSVQVGNVCVGKISPILQREAEGLLRKKKKEIEEEKQRQQKIKWKEYNKTIKDYHLTLEKERDELVERVEQEHDQYILRELFRACKTCQCFRISKDEPGWMINCKTCHNKKK